MAASSQPSSVLPEDVARFAAQADSWWTPGGPFAALHALGPVRLAYLRQQVGTLKGLKVLDVGCGGGLMAEPMAREGAKVTGLDASPEAIEAARAHAKLSRLSIAYQVGTAEALAATGARFDLITALEIVEHVADLPAFVATLAGMVKPGGRIVFATLNKTKLSFLLAVVAAEYVMGWVPPGTHDWERFVPPSRLGGLCEGAGLAVQDCTGIVYKPFSRTFGMAKGRTGVNYCLCARKEG